MRLLRLVLTRPGRSVVWFFFSCWFPCHGQKFFQIIIYAGGLKIRFLVKRLTDIMHGRFPRVNADNGQDVTGVSMKSVPFCGVSGYHCITTVMTVPLGDISASLTMNFSHRRREFHGGQCDALKQRTPKLALKLPEPPTLAAALPRWQPRPHSNYCVYYACNYSLLIEAVPCNP